MIYFMHVSRSYEENVIKTSQNPEIYMCFEVMTDNACIQAEKNRSFPYQE